MTKEETNKLIIQAQNGDKESLNALVENNLALVMLVARKMRLYERVDNYEETLQEGRIALMRAINNFDTTKNFLFSTYACPYIQGVMSNYINKGHAFNNPVRLTRKYYYILSDMRKYAEVFQHENNREPTIEEISIGINKSIKDIKDTLVISDNSYKLDAKVPSDADEPSNLGELIKDTKCYNENMIVDRIVLTESLMKLKPKEYRVIKMKYFEGIPNKLIASKVGMSEGGVKMMEKRVLKKLKNMIGSDDYETSMDFKKRA